MLNHTVFFNLQFSLVESIFVAIMDEFPKLLRSSIWRQIAFRGVCCLFLFAITIPMVCNVSIVIDLSKKSHNALDKYPMMHYFVTEMCTHVHISVTKWCIVG